MSNLCHPADPLLYYCLCSWCHHVVSIVPFLIFPMLSCCIPCPVDLLSSAVVVLSAVILFPLSSSHCHPVDSVSSCESLLLCWFSVVLLISSYPASILFFLSSCWFSVVLFPWFPVVWLVLHHSVSLFSVIPFPLSSCVFCHPVSSVLHCSPIESLSFCWFFVSLFSLSLMLSCFLHYCHSVISIFSSILFPVSSCYICHPVDALLSAVIVLSADVLLPLLSHCLCHWYCPVVFVIDVILFSLCTVSSLSSCFLFVILFPLSSCFLCHPLLSCWLTVILLILCWPVYSLSFWWSSVILWSL